MSVENAKGKLHNFSALNLMMAKRPTGVQFPAVPHLRRGLGSAPRSQSFFLYILLTHLTRFFEGRGGEASERHSSAK